MKNMENTSHGKLKIGEKLKQRTKVIISEFSFCLNLEHLVLIH